MSAIYYVGSCDYKQVEKSLASETTYFNLLFHCSTVVSLENVIS